MNNINLEQFESIKDILSSIEFMDNQSIKETLAYLIKVYIIDKEISYQGSVNDQVNCSASSNQSSPVKNYSEFSELINDLKRKYEFSELNLFSTDKNKTYVKIDGRKMLLNPGAVLANNSAKKPEKNNKPRSEKKEIKKPVPTPPSENNNASGASRFNNLERD